MENQEKRTRIKCSHKRWTKEDTFVLLQKILENKKKFEKPSAQMFYKKIINEEPSLGEYSWIGMRDRIRNLKVKYNDAVTWKANTAAGLLEDSNEKSVEEYIQKHCPFFKEMDDIFGDKDNVTTPSITDSSDSTSLTKVEIIDVHMDEAEPITHVEEEEFFITQEETEDQLENPPLHSVSYYKEQFNKNPRKRSVNSPLDHLVQMHESKLKFLADRLQFDEIANEQHLQFKKEKLEIEKEKLKLERERMHEEFRLKELEIERNYQLKKLEIELKYKRNE